MTAVNVVSVSIGVLAVLFACTWLRPRVSKRRSYALSLAAPGLVLAAAAAILTLTGGARVAPSLWAMAAIAVAAGWSFWPSRERRWRHFESAFRAHAARHDEFHVRDGA